jgi:acetoin utilization deacetylase AcuC-like enzyme
MAIQQVREATAVKNVWVIDTDAHQGNGYARDKLHSRDAHVIIVDLYNAGSTLRPFACMHAKAITPLLIVHATWKRCIVHVTADL